MLSFSRDFSNPQVLSSRVGYNDIPPRRFSADTAYNLLMLSTTYGWLLVVME